jgi:hypothetical protein
MTHTTTPPDETATSLLAPLARGLMRRNPGILSLSIHDAHGHALWSSGDFLLAEDHALIAKVVEDPHDVRGLTCGLWWESADTARVRCALAMYEGMQFRGVALMVFSGLTTGENERGERVTELAPVLPVLAKAIRPVKLECQGPDMPEIETDTFEASIVAALRFENDDANDEFAAERTELGREERLLELIDGALREDEFALHLQPIVSLREDDTLNGQPLIIEVLIRLPTPDLGVLSSHEFLETAERNGRMPAIDRWVVRALLVWMQRNRDRWEGSRAVFSVNLSGKSVVCPDFRNYLERCLDKSGLPLSALRFEVSEIDMGLAPREFAELACSLAARGCGPEPIGNFHI